MANLYVDHNVAGGITDQLRARSHNVVAARELGLERAKDDAHLLLAAQQGRTLISHNRRDFEMLHDAWRRWAIAWQVEPEHAGILIIPQRSPWLYDQVAQEVGSFLASGQPLANELYWWSVGHGWVRQPLPR